MMATPWPGIFVWVALFISDYAMTLACARMYQAGVNQKMVFAGSYEITPYFQKDIDSLRLISPRFLIALVGNGLLMVTIWWCSKFSQVPELYRFMLGTVICIQLAIHTRHWRNFFLFRAMLKNEDIRGRMEYSRPTMLKISSSELMVFAGLFSMLFVFTQSWFILGGAVGCLSVGYKHWRLSRQHAPEPSNPSMTAVRN